MSEQRQHNLCGGPSEAKDADEEIQQLCDQVKLQAQEKANKTFQHFEAKKVKRQVVSGMMYFVKVHVGEDVCVHLKIYKKLPCYGGTVELIDLQDNHDITSHITPF